MCGDCGCEAANERSGAAGVEHARDEDVHVHVDLREFEGRSVHLHLTHAGEPAHAHEEHHGHPHHHHHGHEPGGGCRHARHAPVEVVDVFELPKESEAPRRIELEERILARNDEAAERLRALFEERGIVALNMISSPGSGKTKLLERTLEALAGDVACGVIAGDVATDRDAQRLRDKGAAVTQIETGGSCHLTAERIERALPEVLGEGLDLLFIENVGNLVCPAAFDLGETHRVAVLSTTEGEDKPLKYPQLFRSADVTVLTKLDLLPHLDWDLDACREYLARVAPQTRLHELSARSGFGMDGWLAWLRALSQRHESVGT